MNKKSWYAWVVLLGAGMILFSVTGLIYNTQSLYIAPILEKFPEFSRASFTLTITISSIVMAILCMSLSKVVKKIGVRKMTMIGGITGVLYLFINSIAQSLIVFYLSAVLLGITITFCVVVTAPTLINSWFAKNSGTLLAIATSVGYAGSMIFSPIIGNWIQTYGYQVAYRNNLIFVAVIMAVGILLIRDNPEPEVGPLWADKESNTKQNTNSKIAVEGLTLAEAKKTKSFYLLLFCAFALSFSITSTMQTMAVYAQGLGYSSVYAGVMMSIYSIVNVVATVPCGFLCDKLGVRTVITSGAVAFIVGILLMMNAAVLPSYTMYVVAGLIAYGMIMPLVPIQLSVKQVFGLKEYAGILGVVSSARTIGAAIGMPALQLVYDIKQSYNIAFIIYIAIAIAIIVMIGLATSKKNLKNIKA